jgi:hypothetical protein
MPVVLARAAAQRCSKADAFSCRVGRVMAALLLMGVISIREHCMHKYGTASRACCTVCGSLITIHHVCHSKQVTSMAGFLSGRSQVVTSQHAAGLQAVRGAYSSTSQVNVSLMDCDWVHAWYAWRGRTATQQALLHCRYGGGWRVTRRHPNTLTSGRECRVW